MADLDVKLPVGRLIFGYVILIVLLALVTVATHVVPAGMYAVSYTHLTLPTKRIV